MSGLRVPVFFGSLLTLVVLVIQNRAPVFQLTLLGIRSQPLSLGIWVALAVVAGILLGAILQRTSVRRSPRPRTAANSSSSYDGPAEYQPFRSIPDHQALDDQDEPELDAPEFDAPITESKMQGWNSEASNSWTTQAEKAEEEGRFWSQPPKRKSPKGKVTPIQSKREQTSSQGDTVVDAEYRPVSPESSSNNDGFDDNFFDDFFDEDDA